MLDYLGEPQAAERIKAAIAEVVKVGKKVTRDLNPNNYTTTTEMTDAIIASMQAHR